MSALAYDAFLEAVMDTPEDLVADDAIEDGDLENTEIEDDGDTDIDVLAISSVEDDNDDDDEYSDEDDDDEDDEPDDEDLIDAEAIKNAVDAAEDDGEYEDEDDFIESMLNTANSQVLAESAVQKKVISDPEYEIAYLKESVVLMEAFDPKKALETLKKLIISIAKAIRNAWVSFINKIKSKLTGGDKVETIAKNVSTAEKKYEAQQSGSNIESEPEKVNTSKAEPEKKPEPAKPKVKIPEPPKVKYAYITEADRNSAFEAITDLISWKFLNNLADKALENDIIKNPEKNISVTTTKSDDGHMTTYNYDNKKYMQTIQDLVEKEVDSAVNAVDIKKLYFKEELKEVSITDINNTVASSYIAYKKFADETMTKINKQMEEFERYGRRPLLDNHSLYMRNMSNPYDAPKYSGMDQDEAIDYNNKEWVIETVKDRAYSYMLDQVRTKLMPSLSNCIDTEGRMLQNAINTMDAWSKKAM